ncbi:unnamed protein product [Porites evermanni]|uniref:Reverse transcriptase n=1 Tax=Porites evermanni TaxID=104178 RepID=A0ABN8Q9R8_9CNID|nr:unnamed protein product [Porites evermanni]
MNHDLSNVNTWLTANKLTLNSSKTEFMLIGSRQSLSNKLQKLQNRAARILTFSSYDTSADPLLEQLNWKRLDTQRQIQVATMVYKSIHGLAPDYLGSLFTKYNPPYNLRNSENKLAVPLPRTNFLKNSFSYNGSVI